MQFAAAIHEAAGRIDEASAVFRFKARHTNGEFDDLGGHWSDSRSKHFNQHFLQPQRDAIEEGERLCRRYSELSNSARANAQEAENEIAAFFAVAEEFESLTVELVRAAEIAGQLSQRVVGEAHSLMAEIHDLDSAIAATAQDPGC
jgi:hypothetical protein